MSNNFIERILDSVNYHHMYWRFRRNGYSKDACKRFINKAKAETKKYSDYPAGLRRQFHKWGFFIETADRFSINEKNRKQHLTDLQKIFLKPVNNSFSKWFRERLTPYVVLHPFRKDLPKLYGEVLFRDENHFFIPKHDLSEGIQFEKMEDILSLLKKEGELYISYVGNIFTKIRRGKKVAFSLHYDEAADTFFMDKEECTEEEILEQLYSMELSFLVQENYHVGKPIGKTELKKKEMDVCIDLVSVYVGNHSFDDVSILETSVKIYCGPRRKLQVVPVKSLKTGAFVYRGKRYVIPRWDEICEKAVALGSYVSEVELLKIGFCYKDERILISYVSSDIQLPKRSVINKKLRLFYRRMVNDRKYLLANKTKASKKASREFKRWQKIQIRLVKKGKLRKGIRTYMFILWKNSIIDDLLHTKSYSLRQKIWAWKRGYLSFRIHQYGLTEENYKNYLSDLDYHWLNRINNYTQKWINDKTTFRYALEPFKKHLPEYYFLIMKRGPKVYVKRMMDAPESAGCNIQSVVEVLKEKKELAFKPSAGTHGDGFYKLTFENDLFYINGKQSSEQELVDVLTSQKSFYIVTDYLYLADELAKIYPASLNTIRMLVINEDAKTPKIKHAYMRIGASSSGFTDNIGYGGIAARIDLETGRFYDGETIVNHVFHECEVHPDTGVPVSGYVPHWQETKEGILDICREFPELEYLGFDVAVTEDSFKLLEINIHQDLHKFNEQSEAVKSYFDTKMEQKRLSIEKQLQIENMNKS